MGRGGGKWKGGEGNGKGGEEMGREGDKEGGAHGLLVLVNWRVPLMKSFWKEPCVPQWRTT